MIRALRLAAACAGMLAVTAGCSGLFTSKAPVSRAYMLRPAVVAPAAAEAAAGGAPATKPPFTGTLRVPRPNPAPGFETDRILLLREGRELDYYATGHWAGPIPDLVGALAVESLRRAQLFDGVYSEGAPIRTDYFLQIAIREFVADYGAGEGAPVARVVLDCTLARRLDRSVIAAFTAEGTSPAAANRMTEVVAAYEAALQQALGSASASLAAAAK